MVPFERALVSSYKPSIHIPLSALVCRKFYIAVFSRGCKSHVLGKGRSQGVGDGAIQKSVGEFLQAVHSNFSSIFTRFRDIAAFVLQHATFSLPHLVSRKFPNVPLGVGGSPFGYKERRCWANCPCSQFLRFPTYVITIHQRHRQTDDMRSQDRALH